MSKFQNTSSSKVPQGLGVTRPLNMEGPSEADSRLTQSLADVLRSFDLTESPLELQHRRQVLQKLESLYKEWLRDTCIQMNMPMSITDQVGGRLLAYGSYVQGVHTRGSDIDALCVGPDFIERQVFFSSFYDKIKNLTEVKNIRVIEAFVPVMKLEFDGIEMDLVYARLMKKSIPNSLDLLDTKLLEGMDVKCVRSFQGYRVTQEILKLVPNLKTFRLALRTIRHWAKCRNIYSGRLGFLGGVAWCILVARICQLYPNATASTLVAKFFRVFSGWEWPLPIMLRHPETHNYNLPVWDPKLNPSDRFHLMPIIIPTYPHQNSAYSVTASTLAVMKKEIKRGCTIIEDICHNRASWRKLFEPDTFDQDYCHYLVLTATTANKAQQKAWAPYVESKIRLLVGSLEKNSHIALAHPFTQPFHANDGLSTKWLIGIHLHQNGPNPVNFIPYLHTFRLIVHTHSESWKKGGMEISGAYVKWQNLPSQLYDVARPAQSTSAKTDKAGVKRARSAAGNERCTKKVRVEPARVDKTSLSTPSSSKRPRTHENDPEAKRFKEELTATHTRQKALKRLFKAPCVNPKRRRY